MSWVRRLSREHVSLMGTQMVKSPPEVVVSSLMYLMDADDSVCYGGVGVLVNRLLEIKTKVSAEDIQWLRDLGKKNKFAHFEPVKRLLTETRHSLKNTTALKRILLKDEFKASYTPMPVFRLVHDQEWLERLTLHQCEALFHAVQKKGHSVDKACAMRLLLGVVSSRFPFECSLGTFSKLIKKAGVAPHEAVLIWASKWKPTWNELHKMRHISDDPLLTVLLREAVSKEINKMQTGARESLDILRCMWELMEEDSESFTTQEVKKIWKAVVAAAVHVEEKQQYFVLKHAPRDASLAHLRQALLPFLINDFDFSIFRSWSSEHFSSEVLEGILWYTGHNI
eukprot:TRINITY_DN2004_c2_g1_i2.p1 TRINITY_DN2004_c2_g1~~TRINITY_DN2004_c2_g1_i2.p1  ORF type:complete len:339 (+),score=73.66 TRINITY_DN2004_c2_g1_i2:1090-2106(+)